MGFMAAMPPGSFLNSRQKEGEKSLSSPFGIFFSYLGRKNLLRDYIAKLWRLHSIAEENKGKEHPVVCGQPGCICHIIPNPLYLIHIVSNGGPKKFLHLMI